jgi:predicted NUDIX family phosphoesterase
MPDYVSTPIVGEQIWAVPNHIVRSEFRGSGYIQLPQNELLESLDRIAQYSVIAPRPNLEYNTYYRQIIPYCVLRNNGKFFSMLREKGDSRLSQLYSLGVGGHACLDDVLNGGSVMLALMQAAYREIDEEFGIDEPPFFSDFPGVMLTDDGVSSVHMGIVILCDIDSTDLIPQESDSFIADECKFVSPDYLIANSQYYEPWSQALIEGLTQHV